MSKNTLIVGAAISALMFVSNVQADDKFTLGRTLLLEHGKHAAKIPLLVCRNTNAIQIKAEKGLELRKAVVKFQNGESKTINFYRDLDKDEHSSWRYLGKRRCVKSINVYGNSEGSKAGVRVYGKEQN